MNTETVQIEFEGKTYSAFFRIEKGWVNVSAPMWGTKNAAGGANPHLIAKILLREILEEAKRKNMLD